MSPHDQIERSTAALLERLRTLVAFETVNPPGRDYDAVTTHLVSELRAVGLAARRYRIPNGLLRRTLPKAQWGFPRFNVLGTLRAPGATRTLHFNAHTDVVPAAADGWALGGPFSGRVRAGWIHGRGTADMKGSIASLLTALQALKACGVRPRMNVEVSFTADEETDSALGTGWLVENAPIRPDYAVVMEGGEGACICCGHNGTLWLEVTVLGRAAHGSLPDKGVNALEGMAALVHELAAYKRLLARKTITSPDGRILRPTLNVGGVFGGGDGAKVNTVPARASFSIDRRVLPGEDPAAAERDLRAFLAAAARRIPRCRVSVAKISENFSSFTEPGHPFFQAFAASVARVRRRPAVFGLSTGFNDIHFFARHLRIPTLGYGPGGRDYHGTDERARVADLVASARIYAGLLTTFSG